MASNERAGYMMMLMRFLWLVVREQGGLYLAFFIFFFGVFGLKIITLPGDIVVLSATFAFKMWLVYDIAVHVAWKFYKDISPSREDVLCFLDDMNKRMREREERNS